MCTGTTFCFLTITDAASKLWLLLLGINKYFSTYSVDLYLSGVTAYKEGIILKVFTMLYTRIQKVRPNENGGSFKVNNRYNINIVFWRYFTYLYKCLFRKENYHDLFLFILLSALLKQLIMNPK